jgi:hypothetical protein
VSAWPWRRFRRGCLCSPRPPSWPQPSACRTAARWCAMSAASKLSAASTSFAWTRPAR